MKTVLISIAFVFTFCSTSAQTPLPAQHLLDSVLQRAKAQKKNVFVLFTASWCMPCKDLKRGIYDPYNIQFFEKNYVVLVLYGSEHGSKKINENPGTNELAIKYDGDTSALPYYMILNSKGEKLQDNYIKAKDSDKRENIGFSVIPEELKKFIAILKKTSKLTDGELAMIYDRYQQLNKITHKDDY